STRGKGRGDALGYCDAGPVPTGVGDRVRARRAPGEVALEPEPELIEEPPREYAILVGEALDVFERVHEIEVASARCLRRPTTSGEQLAWQVQRLTRHVAELGQRLAGDRESQSGRAAGWPLAATRRARSPW